MGVMKLLVAFVSSTVALLHQHKTSKKTIFLIYVVRLFLLRRSLHFYFQIFNLERHNYLPTLLFLQRFPQHWLDFISKTTSSSLSAALPPVTLMAPSPPLTRLTHFSIRHSRLCEETPGAYRPNGNGDGALWSAGVIIIITGTGFNSTALDDVCSPAEQMIH